MNIIKDLYTQKKLISFPSTQWKSCRKRIITINHECAWYHH